MRDMARCLIALGANLGDGVQTLEAALAQLAQHPQIAQLAHSRLYQTAPIGGPAGQPPFVNAVARCETTLSPAELLAVLQAIERQHGRQRREHWGPRTLDLDLLLYDQHISSDAQLTLPHPRMAWRRFVMEPALEIASDWQHPSTSQTLSQLWQQVNAVPSYLALTSSCWFAKIYVASTAVERLTAANTPARGTTLRGMTVFGPPVISDPEHSSTEHYCELMPRLGAELRKLLSEKTDTWLISNYWPEEIKLGAQLWFDGEAQQLALQAWEEAFGGLPSPNLLAYLETPDELLLLDRHAPGHVDNYYEQADRLASQRDALSQLVAGYRASPILQLSAAKPELAIVEIVAALQAVK